jgi:glutathione S-transferase
MKRLVRTLVPLMAPAVRWDYTVNEETGRRARERIVAAMDRVEAELGARDYLVGDAFSVADLTAAALFTPVLCPPGASTRRRRSRRRSASCAQTSSSAPGASG